MFSTIKNIITLSVFFLVMSYPVKNKPLFSYVYDVTSPMTKPLYKKADHLISHGYAKTKRLVRDLFFNAEPKVSIKSFTDSVNQRLSSQSKVKKRSPSYKEGLDEHISNKDQKDLKRLFKE